MPLRLLLRHAGNIAGGDRAREQRDEAFEQEGGEEEREEKREEKRERQCAVDVRRGKYQGIFVRDVNPPPSTVGNRSCGEGKKKAERHEKSSKKHGGVPARSDVDTSSWNPSGSGLPCVGNYP
jgi:hypothetical protein